MSENELITPVDASDIITDHLTEYGRHIIASHFPHRIDGLKKVHRRIIHVAKGFPEYGVNGDKAIGAIKELHDHGSASTYETIVRLSQPHHVYPALMKIHGDNGSYAEEKAAASRYIDVSLPPFARDLFYTQVNEMAIPVVTSTVDLQSKEPAYLIPVIPTALWFGSVTVGFGFSSKSAPRNFNDICDLAIAYCQYRKQYPSPSPVPFPFHEHAHLYLPDFPTPGTLTNAEALLESYRQGDVPSTIEIEGTVVLTHQTILIHSIPYGTPFKTVKPAIEKEMMKKGGWVDQNIVDVNDYSDTPGVGCIEIKLKRGVNVFDAWIMIRDTIQFTDTYHEKMNYCDEFGYMYSLDIYACLELWYQARYDIIAATKRRALKDLTRQQRTIEAYLIIGDHTDDVVKILRESATPNDAAQSLKERFPELTQFQVNHLLTAKITILTKTSPIELRTKHAEVTEKITQITSSFSTITDEMVDTIYWIKKKYPTPRITSLPNYIGYVSIDHGCYQISSHEEIMEVMDRFPRSEISIHMYDGPHLYHVDPRNRFLKGNIPKYTRGDIYGLPVPQDQIYTITLDTEAGLISCTNGMVPGTRDRGFHYVTDRAVMIHRSGAITRASVPKTFRVHKKLGTGVKTDLLYIYPDTHRRQDNYLAILNSEEPNTLWIRKVERNEVPLSPVGSFHITHHYGTKNWYFTIAPSYLNRLNIRVIYIPDLKALMGDLSYVKIDLAAKKCPYRKTLKRLQ